MTKSLFIIFLFLSFNAFAQTPNIGFEEGTFNHWDCYIGQIDSLGRIAVKKSAPINGRQTIYGKLYDGATLDPYGKFPVICPNGSNYSIRLGNEEAMAQAERLSYTFTVPNQKSYSIIFNYAVVLENPNHLAFQQPKFTAEVYDVTDNISLECPYFNFAASSTLPGFKLSTVAGAKGESIYYKDWSTATIDLSNYAGKKISIIFTTNDCTKVVHFGYAYLDINESNGNPIAGNSYCAGQRSARLYAPSGFAAYEWYTADLSKKIGAGPSLTISPPPPDNAVYALKIFPYPGLGCIDTVYTTVKKIDEGFRLKVPDTIRSCPGSVVDLTAPEVSAGTSPQTTLSYFIDSLGTSYLYDPKHVTASGTYYIQGINNEGCMNILPVTVQLSLPEIIATDPPPVDFPVTVDLSKTFVHKPGLTYTYFKDEATQKEVDNYVAVKYGGIYYIKATTSEGCSKTVKLNVVIHPPPPYVVTAPNTFTPNSDGINDRFSVSFSGIATFKSVKIYDRYGRLVFITKSQNGYWEGNYNGHTMPEGVYYWVLDGFDDYNQLEISKAGSITLLR